MNKQTNKQFIDLQEMNEYKVFFEGYKTDSHKQSL